LVEDHEGDAIDAADVKQDLPHDLVHRPLLFLAA